MDFEKLKSQLEAVKQQLVAFLKKKKKSKSAESDGKSDDVEDVSEKDATVIEKACSFIKSFLQKVGKKNIIMMGGAIVLLIVLFVAWTIYSNISQQHKATDYIMQQVALKPVMIQELGSGIVATSRGDGDIEMPAMTGEMTIPIKGNMMSGNLKVTLNEGVLSQVNLTKMDGQQIDILELEKKKQLKAQQKAKKKAQYEATKSEFDKALLAMQHDNYDVAILGFKQAIQANYRKHDAYEYLGVIYSEKGDYANCIDSFMAYLKLKPNNAKVYYQMAYCYLERYDVDNALIYLNKSCKLGNDSACQAAAQIEKQREMFQQTIKKKEDSLTGRGQPKQERHTDPQQNQHNKTQSSLPAD